MEMGNIDEWKKWKKKNGRQETRDRREDNEAEQECHFVKVWSEKLERKSTW